MRKILSALLLMLVASAASAHSYQQGDIKIGHIWARATAPGQTTAVVYVPLLNTGKETDRLMGASSDVADKIEIHESMNDNGISKMPKLDSVTLEPNKPVALRPGGIHLMLFGVKRPLKAGDMFPLTLQFEKAGAAKVEVMVATMGAMSGSEMPGEHE